MKKLIFWDLDGTLIDTLEDLGAAVNHALGLRGLPLLGPEDFRKMVGSGVRNLVAQALEKTSSRTDDAFIDSALADFKEYYCAHIDTFTRPYSGMPELLTELSAAGVKMAVVSNKFQEGTEHLVKEFFPEVDFVAILGNRPGWPLKPSPEIVEDVLGRCEGIRRPDALLVGDSPTDMRTALNGGIDAIAVTWGYSSPEELKVILPDGAPRGTRLAGSIYELRRMLSE